MRAVLLAALVLAGVVLYFAWPREATDSRAPAPASVDSPGPRPDAPAVATPRALIDPEGTRRNVAASSEPAAPAPTAPAEPAAKPRKPGVRVRVVDSSGAPLARVPVVLLASTSEAPMPPYVARTQTSAEDGVALLEFDLKGKPVPADLRFLAAIGLPLEPRVARDLGPRLPADASSAEIVELVLPETARDWLAPLTVQLVDAGGAPVAGAGVVFESLVRTFSSGTNELGRGMTLGPYGLVRFDRMEQIEGALLARLMQVELDYQARCEGPFVPPPVVDIPATPSREPARLVLPPTGSVLVRLRHADGAPVGEPASAMLSYFPSGGEVRAGYARSSFVRGNARFERVGLGLDLRAYAALDDSNFEAPPELRFPGPRAAGETLEIELVLGAEVPALVGRLLDEGGEPAREMPFSLGLEPRGPRERSNQSYHTTDAAGRFHVSWNGALHLPGRYLRFEESPPRSGAPPGWIARFAEVDFPALSSEGSLEVGDLSLTAVPVLLAGEVVDSLGQPVRQATIRLRHPEGEGADERWVNLRIPHVSTGERGRFEARSLERVRVLSVSASQNKVGESEELLVAPGRSDVRLVLLPGEDFERTRGKVAGQLAVDADIPLISISAELHSADGERDTMPFAGAFRFERVLPGTHRFELRTMQTDWLIAAVDDIQVRAGETTRDPRLIGLDLRGRLRLLRLGLESADGQPLAKVEVQLEVAGEGGDLWSDEQGRLVAVVRSEDEAFELSVEGFAPLTVGWAPDEQRIVLEPK